MTDTVSIPRDVATDLADVLSDRCVLTDARRREVLAVLRPEVTLREKVATELWGLIDVRAGLKPGQVASMVLAIIADDIESLPSGGIHGSTPHYRAAILARLRATS